MVILNNSDLGGEGFCNNYDKQLPTINEIKKNPKLLPILLEMIQLKNELKNLDTWAIKSPLFMRTITMWNHIFKDIIIIYCYRNPDSLMDSVHNKLKGFNFKPSLNYWRNHNLTFLNYLISNNLPVILINYDEWFENAEKVYYNLIQKLKNFNININLLNENQLKNTIDYKQRNFNKKLKFRNFSTKKIWEFLTSWYDKQQSNNSSEFMYIDCMDSEQISKFIISDKKICKLNDICKCGSKLKYKKCCY